MNIKRADWVTCKDFPNIYGIVTRVAKSKEWADIKWNNSVSKRMKTEALIVEHTIPALGGYITDMTRERELKEDKLC